MARSSPIRKITTEIDGVTYEGKYLTHDGSVIVWYDDRWKETWFRDNPESIAHLLLGELVREPK
jgi:hypothetical protein